MNLDTFFNKVVKELDLGTIIQHPEPVFGGLTHQMYKLFTDQGKYIIKILNTNIMKNQKSRNKYYQVEHFENILKQNKINAIYSLQFNNQSIHQIDNYYFYVYKWYDGKILSFEELTNYHCIQISKELANIHKIDIVNKPYTEKEKHIDWEHYINLAKESNKQVYNLIYDKLDILNESMNKGNESIKYLPNYYSICHNDMDPKNVLWLDKNFKIIDFDNLGYNNPYIDFMIVALCWSGFENYTMDYELFKTFFNNYFNNINLDKIVNWEAIYYANNIRLEWLEYNINRALMIDASTKEEQELGLKEVEITIERIVYYANIKDELLNNIQELIKKEI